MKERLIEEEGIHKTYIIRLRREGQSFQEESRERGLSCGAAPEGARILVCRSGRGLEPRLIQMTFCGSAIRNQLDI